MKLIKKCSRLAILVCFLVCTRFAEAQTLPPGVINAPPTVIGDFESMGSDTTLNVLPGGSVGKRFNAGAVDGSSTNVEMNISGGTVGLNASFFSDYAFNAYAGSVVNISGGEVGIGSNANFGSEVNISGGKIGLNTSFFNDSSFNANSGSVVNILGGEVGSGFNANFGSVVNITGGSIGQNSFLSFSPAFSANAGSTINISGGEIGGLFRASSTSTVNIAGGTFGSRFEAAVGSLVSLSGGEFLLNGVVPASSTVPLSDLDVLSGTLEDGSVFIFSPLGGDSINDVSLVNTTVPVINTTPIVIPSDTAPANLRQGQMLTLQDGGALPDEFAATSATINIIGGTAGSDLKAVDSQVNISGGSVGSSFKAYSGSLVNITGGEVGSDFQAHSGSVVSMSGGQVNTDFEANSGSTVNVTGGSFGSGFNAAAGSQVSLSGGEFLLNGIAPIGSMVTLDSSDVLSGTLEDGSVFIFSPLGGDSINDVSLVNTTVPVINTTPIVIPSDTAPANLRQGQTLTLQDGGALPDGFAATSATINIIGGTAGSDLKAVDSQVNISGGSVGSSFKAYSGSLVNITGGEVGTLKAYVGSLVNIIGGEVSGFIADSGSLINITGGTVGTGSIANAGSTVNLLGGFVDKHFKANAGSVVNISGGETGHHFNAHSGSVVNLSDGKLGSGAVMHSGSVLNISGGTTGSFKTQGLVNIIGGDIRGVFESLGQTNISNGKVGTRFEVRNGVVNFSGGSIGSGNYARIQSVYSYYLPAVTVRGLGEINITGGEIGYNFIAEPDSSVNISGGRFDSNFVAQAGSDVRLIGGEFLINGLPPTDSMVSLTQSDVLTGTLEDGSVFVFTPLDEDVIGGVSLVTGELPPLVTTPITANSPLNLGGLRAGQVLTLESGGELPVYFAATDATLNIAGGNAGTLGQFVDSQINLSEGTLGYGFQAFGNTTLDMSGGIVSSFMAHTHGSFNGIVGIRAFDGTTVNISGGDVQGSVWAEPGSQFNLFVTSGFISGMPLAVGTTTILDRDTTLSGILTDGSSFSFDLNGSSSKHDMHRDFFSAESVVTVTRFLPGDFNFDGKLDGLDFLAWQRGESVNPYSSLDLTDWQDNYGSTILQTATQTPVPEPSSIVGLLALSTTLAATRLRLVK